MRPDKIDISPELREKTASCKTPDELLELARPEGHELSDEQLEVVAGGCDVPEELVNRVPGKYVIKGVIVNYPPLGPTALKRGLGREETL